jgi:hypothetical protein
MLDTETIKEWIELDEQRKNLEGQIDEIKNRLSALEEIILENFASEGIDAFKINGNTVSPQKYTFAVIVDGDKDRAYEALRKAGYGHYIQETCNSKSLSSLVSDLLKTDGQLPEVFDGAISSFDKIKLRRRKS